MNRFRIKLVDTVFLVKCIYPTTEQYCEDYLDSAEEKYRISITKEDIKMEVQKSIYQLPDYYYEILALYRKIAEIMIEENVLLFHSSVIAVEGQAYAFAAPSGTGKSTHTRLWREALFGKEIVMINDDKPLIKIEDKARVFGTPWDGKERLNNNTSAPLKGICFLKQGNQNKIRKMERVKVLPSLLKQTYRSSNKEKLQKTIVLLNSLSNMVPVYEMTCTISNEAAVMAYNYMSEGE